MKSWEEFLQWNCTLGPWYYLKVSFQRHAIPPEYLGSRKWALGPDIDVVEHIFSKKAQLTEYI